MRNPRINYLIKRTRRTISSLYLKVQKNILNIVLFFILLLLFSFLAYQVADTSTKGQERRKILIQKRDEVEALLKINKDLTEKNEYYKSRRYVEEQARNVLGLSFIGEKAVIVEGLNSIIEKNESEKPVLIPEPPKKSNLEKWRGLIFD